MPGTFQTKSGILTRHLIYSVSFFVEKNSRNLKPPSFSSLGRREHQEWIMTRHFFVLTVLGSIKSSFRLFLLGGRKLLLIQDKTFFKESSIQKIKTKINFSFLKNALLYKIEITLFIFGMFCPLPFYFWKFFMFRQTNREMDRDHRVRTVPPYIQP